MKKAKLWRQYIGAGNITQGSEVRQTVRLNSSDRIMEIRKTRFNSLDFFTKAKVIGCLNVGLYSNSNCLVYKIIKP